MAKTTRLAPVQREFSAAHSIELRRRIGAAALITRLKAIAHGEVQDDPAAMGVQVRAALGLLAKCLPDLASVTLDMQGGDGKLVIEHRIVNQTIPPPGRYDAVGEAAVMRVPVTVDQA